MPSQWLGRRRGPRLVSARRRRVSGSIRPRTVCDSMEPAQTIRPWRPIRMCPRRYPGRNSGSPRIHPVCHLRHPHAWSTSDDQPSCGPSQFPLVHRDLVCATSDSGDPRADRRDRATAGSLVARCQRIAALRLRCSRHTSAHRGAFRPANPIAVRAVPGHSARHHGLVRDRPRRRIIYGIWVIQW